MIADVLGPGIAEVLPTQHVDAARAQERPQRHLHGPGLGAGNDADEVAVGDRKLGAGALDDFPQARLADGVAVRAADEGVPEAGNGPAGAFGAGTG